MRIQFVLAEPAPGGVEILTRNLAAEFIRQGHSCHMTFISKASDDEAAQGFERAFCHSLGELGISYGILGRQVRKNPVLGAARLRAEVRAFKPDLLHTHLGYGLLFQAISLLRVPTVYTHHSVVTSFPQALFRVFDQFVDHYVAICKPVLEELRPWVKGPIEIIENGVPDTFRPRPDRTLRQNSRLLSVGRLEERKDYPTLIEAVAQVATHLARQDREIRLSIAGDGEKQDALQALIDERGLHDRVEFLGARTDVPRLLSEADLLVNSSAVEGFPLALIEGAAAAVPIVATDVGGTSEIVRHGENGLIVPPRRPDLLAQAIIEALSSEARYAELVQAGRRLSDRFSLSACANAHLALYKRVLDARSRRAAPLRRAASR